MKTSFKTIKAIVIIILITSGFALAQESLTTGSNPNLPARPEKRSGESDASYMNRARAWEAEVRRLTSTNPGTTVSSSGIPVRPTKRAGESDASFRNRTIQWEAEVRRITSEQAAQQQKDEELKRLKQEIDKLTAQVLPTLRTGSYTNIDSENMLIIPSGEMKTEELLSINEDMNIMSRILFNELNQEIKNTTKIEWDFFDGEWVANNSSLGQSVNTLNSMYLQGYGALFQIKVNFPLSVPSSGVQSEESQTEESRGSLWDQTRQQIYEPQASGRRTTGMGYIGERKTTEVTYDPQKVENLKISLIQALRHASNIRALQPDESVILRIIGTGQSLKIITAQKQENDVHDIWLITLESEGTRYTITVSGDIDANLKIMSAPAALIIRAKKSDIDAFARDELDLEQFRQRVQIISFPLLQTTLPSTTTPGRTTGTRRTDTTGITTSSTSRRGRTTTAVVPKPTYETEN